MEQPLWTQKYRQTSNISRTKSQNVNVPRLVLQSSFKCPIHWCQVLSREWRWVGVINNFFAYQGATYIRGLTVIILCTVVSNVIVVGNGVVKNSFPFVRIGTLSIRHQAIAWTNAHLLSTRPLGTQFNYFYYDHFVQTSDSLSKSSYKGALWIFT